MKRINKAIAALLKGLVYAYRYSFSSVVGRYCRFQPTCSAYALEALEKQGPWRGGWLVLKRLSRCHPLSFLGGGSGYDPVPSTENSDDAK